MGKKPNSGKTPQTGEAAGTARWKAVAAVAAAFLLGGGIVYFAMKPDTEEIKTYGLSAPPPAPNLAAPVQAPPSALPPSPEISLPDLPPAQLGDRLFERRRFDEAVIHYRAALSQNPKDADTWNDLGLALHYTGKSEDAVSALRKAVEADPKYQIAWLSLGFVLSDLKRLDEANKALKTCVALGPDTPQGVEAKKFLIRNHAEAGTPPAR